MPLDVIQAIGTSWPFWVTVTAVAFMLIFRGPLQELIRRVTGIGRHGITTTAVQEQQRQAQAPPDPRRAADELLAHLDNQYIRQVEGAIRAEFTARGLTPENPETARVLFRYFAVLAVGLDFAALDQLMWGSQVKILTVLNTRPDAPADALRAYYDAAAPQSPILFGAYPFENYMHFLVSQGLIEQRADRFLITLKGRTFLQFLVSAGRPLQRPL